MQWGAKQVHIEHGSGIVNDVLARQVGALSTVKHKAQYKWKRQLHQQMQTGLTVSAASVFTLNAVQMPAIRSLLTMAPEKIAYHRPPFGTAVKHPK